MHLTIRRNDIVSVSAVGSLKEDLPPGKFVIVNQFIDRTFEDLKLFDDEIVAHAMAHPTSNGLMNACEEAIKNSNIDYQRNELYSYGRTAIFYISRVKFI